MSDADLVDISILERDEDYETVDEDDSEEDQDAPEYGDAGTDDDNDGEDEEMDDEAINSTGGGNTGAIQMLENMLDEHGDAQVDLGISTGETIRTISIRDLLALMRSESGGGAAPRPPPRRMEFPPVTEPQDKGVELLYGGEFGRVSAKAENVEVESRLGRLLRHRRTRARPLCREDLISHVVPNTNGVAVAQYDASAYVGQYSADSSFYYTCTQDWQLHVYDTTAAHKPWEPRSRRHQTSGHQTTMSVIKDIHVAEGRWTITDSHLSPDNQRMIYSSITSTVYMTSTLDSSPEQKAIEFADRRRTPSLSDWGDRFAIWSCRFSADGNEVVAAGSGKLFVYDLLADKRTVKIAAHDDDVNSCTWADTASGNVLISASDDTFLKVWDRRSLGGSSKPAGVLVGHTEGLTNVSAKGDGRYVISNGKDQALRLWDLRYMRSSAEFDAYRFPSFSDPHFDYRYGNLPRSQHAAHPKDCSVMTYRGHQVLQTLIRCNFSPNETTGGRYIYSGSSDGRIHIWSLDGRVVQVLDRKKALPLAYDPSEPEPPSLNSARGACVRDVSWHSSQPVLMSVAWATRHEGSIVARHEWKGLGKMSQRLEDWVDKQSAEYIEQTRASEAKQARAAEARSRRLPGAFEEEDIDDDDDGDYVSDEE